MEIKASISQIRISPRKLRLLTRDLRNLKPQKALEKLQFFPQKGKIFLQKLIKQGVANAVNNFKLSADNLVIKEIQVSEGPSIKRMDKSHGARFDRGLLKKRSSRLLLVLTEKVEEKTEVEPEKEEKKVKTKKTVKVIKDQKGETSGK